MPSPVLSQHTPGGQDTRGRLHGMWAAVAPAWSQHAGYADQRGAPVGDAMLDLANPRPGERVLELACGPGGLALAAAGRVAPGGEVVASDVVGAMVEIARQRATAAGISNVRTRVLDLEEIAEPDGSYEVVLCREGLMFATDPARAAGEIRRVLRAQGRVAVAVWGPRERNPWLGLVFDAVAAELKRPLPPPGIPGPFSLGDRERLQSVLLNAGLTDVTVSELAVPLRSASFEEWWTRTSALAGPLARILASLPQPAIRSIGDRLGETTAEYRTATGLEFPGLSLIASARNG